MSSGNFNSDTPSPLDSSPNSFNGGGISNEGVNLGSLGGMPMSGQSSLLVASSIAPDPNEMRGIVPVVNSSLAAAAAAGGTPLRSGGPSSSPAPPENQVQGQNQPTGAPAPRRSHPPHTSGGTSSLAAAAGLVQQPTSTTSQPHAHHGQHLQQQHHPSYQDSQMQMHMYQQAQYRQQHSYPPPPQIQHPNMHPTHGHGVHPHGQEYHQHQAHVGGAGSLNPAYGQNFADQGPRASSGSEQGSESVGIGSSQHDTEVEPSGEDDEGAENGPVKLFVGQVPKSMEEAELTRAFQVYGDIKEILVIRDRHTGQHRGCSFVTFYNPEDAARVQETLHDKFTFPEGRKPVQIKPASEPSNSISPSVTPEQENKLFVGMTSRNADEDSIRELFSPFGAIREIYIIRNADGSNKGCAFLKYADNESALNAIETLNDKFTMEGATRPLIVKFADTKAQRKARTSANARLMSAHQRIEQPGIHAGPQTGYYIGPGPHVPVYPNYQQAPPPMAMPPQYTQSPYSGSYPQGTPPPPPSYMYQQHPYAQTSPYGYPPPAGPFGPGQPHADGSPVPSSAASYDGSTGGNGGAPPSHLIHHQQPRSSLASRQQHGGVGIPRSQKPYPRQEISGAVNPRPREGPAGANLFIYHLPHDLTDADLATAFNPFGNVISAKVYVDKFTGESKGFGFVSYDSVISAEQAIEQMNGFQIGSKRLKVQHKRVSKPPTGQQLSTGADNPPVPRNIAPMHADPNAMISGLPPPSQQPHHPQQLNPQPLPSHLDVEGLTGNLQILDVQYAEDDE